MKLSNVCAKGQLLVAKSRVHAVVHRSEENVSHQRSGGSAIQCPAKHSTMTTTNPDEVHSADSFGSTTLTADTSTGAFGKTDVERKLARCRFYNTKSLVVIDFSHQTPSMTNDQKQHRLKKTDENKQFDADILP